MDTSAKKLNLTPTYFVFRHVSQYVDPGATRLDTTGGAALAFENLDGSIPPSSTTRAPRRTSPSPSRARSSPFAMPSRGWATLNVKP